MYLEELNKRRVEYLRELEPISKELQKISVEWMDIRTAQITYREARWISGLMTTETINTSKFISWLEVDLATKTNIRAPGENLALQELKRLPKSVPAQTLRADIEKEYQYYLHLVHSDSRGTGEYFLRYRERLEASVASLKGKVELVDRQILELK
jgi:hypothetical protein